MVRKVPFSFDQYYLYLYELEHLGQEIAKHGLIPLLPGLMYQYYTNIVTEVFWIESAQALIKKSHAVYIKPTWLCTQEKDVSSAYGIPVFYTLEALYDWNQSNTYKEFLPWTTSKQDPTLNAAKELSKMGVVACMQLSKYLESGDPAVVTPDNVNNIFNFLLCFSRHELDVLAERLKDIYTKCTAR